MKRGLEAIQCGQTMPALNRGQWAKFGINKHRKARRAKRQK